MFPQEVTNYLKERDYQIVCQNFKARQGEIDIIAKNQEGEIDSCGWYNYEDTMNLLEFDNIIVTDIDMNSLSSTEIRNLLEHGKDAKRFLSESVNDYIKFNKLHKIKEYLFLSISIIWYLSLGFGSIGRPGIFLYLLTSSLFLLILL